MSWGYKILIAICCFIIGMVFMVTLAMKQTNEMFDEQYYAKELKYQELIDAEENLNKLSDTIVINQSVDGLKISLPSFNQNENIEGSISFLRPSDQAKDFEHAITSDNYNNLVISKDSFINGEYKVRFKWRSSGVDFYKEKAIFIQ